jgi:20S proteasome subunit alpha 6
MESVKQGSACVGLRSESVCVLAALKRSVSALARHQAKLWEIDHHMAVGIAGLTADARSLAKYMQNECLQHAYVYGCPLPPHQLMADLADKHQRTTQTYVRRPFGVGLLVAAVDTTRQSCHLYQTCPSGNVYELIASAMGARSQSARTYLEKHYMDLKECSTDELIVHALQALVGCVSGDEDLTPENTSIAIVGLGQTYTLLEGEALQPYLSQLPARAAPAEEEEDQGEQGEGGENEPAAMET